ncbi:MAG: hypothetical protein KBT27_11285 [Prevotellaceae bacterium]|nr:hypothetical protein [Candidatus Faecinaster equi]
MKSDIFDIIFNEEQGQTVENSDESYLFQLVSVDETFEHKRLLTSMSRSTSEDRFLQINELKIISDK